MKDDSWLGFLLYNFRPLRRLRRLSWVLESNNGARVRYVEVVCVGRGVMLLLIETDREADGDWSLLCRVVVASFDGGKVWWQSKEEREPFRSLSPIRMDGSGCLSPRAQRPLLHQSQAQISGSSVASRSQIDSYDIQTRTRARQPVRFLRVSSSAGPSRWPWGVTKTQNACWCSEKAVLVIPTYREHPVQYIWADVDADTLL